MSMGYPESVKQDLGVLRDAGAPDDQHRDFLDKCATVLEAHSLEEGQVDLTELASMYRY